MFSFVLFLVKVIKFQKQFIVSSLLPKNKHWDNFIRWKLSQRSFFGRFEDTIICFSRKQNVSNLQIFLCTIFSKKYFLNGNHIWPTLSVSWNKEKNATETVVQVRLTMDFKIVHGLKFIYSEKALKFCEIFTLLLTGLALHSRTKVCGLLGIYEL